jgi:type I restriction enzyme R subunit
MKPAVERWGGRYKEAHQDAEKARVIFERTKRTKDPVLIANAEGDLKEARKELDFLGGFKAVLVSDVAPCPKSWESFSGARRLRP